MSAVQHRAPTDSQNVGDRLGELDVGVFQGLLNPLGVTRDLADQLLARAGQVASPVASMAACVTPFALSQSPSWSNPRVLVDTVRYS